MVDSQSSVKYFTDVTLNNRWKIVGQYIDWELADSEYWCIVQDVCQSKQFLAPKNITEILNDLLKDTRGEFGFDQIQEKRKPLSVLTELFNPLTQILEKYAFLDISCSVKSLIYSKWNMRACLSLQ